MTEEQGGIEVAVVSGLSGAGRSTAAKVLEDLGWFVVDNLPPELIATMVELGARSQGAITRVAVVMDVRSRAFTDDLAAVIKDLDARGYRPKVLYLEATDAVLIRRFEQVRRSHPLQSEAGWLTGSPPSGHCSPRCATRLTWCWTPPGCPYTSCGPRSSMRSVVNPAPGPGSLWCPSATNTGCRWTPTS